MKSRTYEFIGILALIIVALVIKGACNDEVKYKKVVTNAYITKVTLTSKPVLPRVEYYYIKGADTFRSYCDVDQDVRFSDLEKLNGHILLLVYDSTNVKANRILITEADFNKYEVWYPDSLFWLKRLVGK